jgi:hypothetical protein
MAALATAHLYRAWVESDDMRTRSARPRSGILSVGGTNSGGSLQMYDNLSYAIPGPLERLRMRRSVTESL